MNGWTSVMNHRFDSLGFAPGYVCEVDPELPGTGQCGCPWAAGDAMAMSPPGLSRRR